MPLPKKQIADLRIRRKIHSGRIAELKKQMEFLQKEIEVHESIVSLVSNRSVLSVLSKLCEDQEQAKLLVGKEKAFLKKSGLELPRGSHVSIFGGQDGSARVRLDVSSKGGIPYTLEWDSKIGFAPGAPRRPARARR